MRKYCKLQLKYSGDRDRPGCSGGKVVKRPIRISGGDGFKSRSVVSSSFFINE